MNQAWPHEVTHCSGTGKIHITSYYDILRTIHGKQLIMIYYKTIIITSIKIHYTPLRSTKIYLGPRYKPFISILNPSWIHWIPYPSWFHETPLLVGGLEHFLFFHILVIIIPNDDLIFFRGVGIPPTRYYIILPFWIGKPSINGPFIPWLY